MANTISYGFFPSHNTHAGDIVYRRYRVLSNNTNAVNCYDAVKRASHDVTSCGESSTQSTAIDSVAVGCSYIDATGARRGAKNLPATTVYSGSTNDPYAASYLYLVDDPLSVEFKGTVDTAPAIADMNLNFSINLSAGSNGYSKQTVNYASKATTATLPLRMRDFVFGAFNNIDATNAQMFFQINAGQDEPALTAGTGS